MDSRFSRSVDNLEYLDINSKCMNCEKYYFTLLFIILLQNLKAFLHEIFKNIEFRVVQQLLKCP